MSRALTFLVHLYQLCFRPWLGANCRFEPPCSEYARLAIERHGAMKGSYFAALRLCRCHPFCEGGFDPVP